MHVETVYQHASFSSDLQARWLEYLKLNGGAAQLQIVVDWNAYHARLDVWTQEQGFCPLIELSETALRGSSLEQARSQLLQIAEDMLRFSS